MSDFASQKQLIETLYQVSSPSMEYRELTPPGDARNTRQDKNNIEGYAKRAIRNELSDIVLEPCSFRLLEFSILWYTIFRAILRNSGVAFNSFRTT